MACPLRPHRVALLTALALWTRAPHAPCGRPLTNDDAGVVGDRRLQLETWLYLDSYSLDHALGLAFGPLEWLEVAAGVSYGIEHSSGSNFGFQAPVVQLKGLVREPNAWPGLAVAVGTATPLGRGHLAPVGAAVYGYASLTKLAWHERLAVHVNGGLVVSEDGDRAHTGWTAGTAVQVALVDPWLSSFGEVYWGSLYDARSDPVTVQAGLMGAFDADTQLDATGGVTFAPDVNPQSFATLGIKLVGDL